MSAVGTIARRTFLIGSAVVAGGVAFGIYTVKKDPANPLADALGDGEATFNPWVKISRDAITLITPHTDLGQGARSLQAALIAEELDLDFGQFEVSAGEPSAAYWNTTMGASAAPSRPGHEPAGAAVQIGIMGTLMKVIGMQVTGGSSTVPDVYKRLREAGAVARETLKKAAAKRAGVRTAQLKTEAGAVVLPDGSKIPYTDLAEDAARIAPVKSVTLRHPSEWRLIGKPMQRLDIVGKSTGTLDYGIDLAMDGMVHAAVKTNPRQGAAMNSFDAEAARAMRGVQKIVEVTNGVAVVADNTWRAMKAVNAIEFDWADAPYPHEMDAHWEALATSFTDEKLDNEWRNDGDVEGVLAAADDVVEMEYRAPYLAHAPLEPIGAVIHVQNDRVDIWVAHQIPRIAEQMVADITGVDVANVHLHNQYCGGSFGHRLEFDNVRYAAEIGTKMRGTPVKLTYSREEDFAHDYVRQIAISRVRGSVANGQVQALDLGIAAPSVVRSQFGRIGMSSPGPDGQLAEGAFDAPYDVPNMRMRSYAVEGLAPVSSWRSVGASTNGFFAESALDELIIAAGADPLEERLRLCDWKPARDALEAAGEMSNWGSPLGPNRGRGIAMVFSFSVPVVEVVEVTDTPQGIKIDKVFVAANVGRVIDPINFDNHVKGGVVWGLGHAMNCEITYKDGMAEQTNFHAFEAMRLYQCPEIMVRGLDTNPEVRGIGEPPVPPAAPALANAIFNATGKRVREMPFGKHVKFV